MLDSDFALLEVPAAVSQDYYSPDGNVWLHLEAESLPGELAYLAILPIGTIPEPLPAGIGPVGSGYSLGASGIVTGTLRLRCSRWPWIRHSCPPGVEPAAVQLSRWNGAGGSCSPAKST